MRQHLTYGERSKNEHDQIFGRIYYTRNSHSLLNKTEKHISSSEWGSTISYKTIYIYTNNIVDIWSPRFYPNLLQLITTPKSVHKHVLLDNLQL